MKYALPHLRVFPGFLVWNKNHQLNQQQVRMDSDAGDPSAGHYNDTNRAFLQSFLARGTLTSEEGRKLLAAIFTAQDSQYQTTVIGALTDTLQQTKRLL
jgi:hypothetical protein